MQDNPDIIISSNGALESRVFGDIYFSREDGLEETKYIFLEGNNLEQRFQKKEKFRIVELGFGTGLNFLATLNYWKKHYKADKKLYYIGIEKFPLSFKQISQALSMWPELQYNLLLEKYPNSARGIYKIDFLDLGIELLLVFDDANNAVKRLSKSVDAWFLDGFTPLKNPDMWSETIFKRMAKISENDATFATFTASSIVKRGLESVGFKVIKQKGFGRKRHMLVGSIKTKDPRFAYKAEAKEKKALIIGAGIAGSAAAYFLSKRGWEVKIFEKEGDTATQASGNNVGILYPRLEAAWNSISQFYYQALKHLLRTFDEDHLGVKCDFNKCGLLMLPQKEDLLRFEKIHSHQKLDYARLVSAHEASEISGVEITYPCLYFPQCGTLSIPKLCKAITTQSNISLNLNSEVTNIKFEDNRWQIFSNEKLLDSSEILIIANSYSVNNLESLRFINVEMIRGQITYLPELKEKNLKTVLCYGGYITPTQDGYHHLGATFDKTFLSTEISHDSSHKNIAQLNKMLPNLLENIPDIKSLKGRAAIRCYSRDKVPMIGLCPNPDFYLRNDLKNPYLKGLYLSICHGSRGGLSGMLAGEIIAAQIGSNALIIDQEIYKLIDPSRFFIREQRRLRI